MLNVADARDEVAVDGSVEAGPVADDAVEAADVDEVPGGGSEQPMRLDVEALEFGVGRYSGEVKCQWQLKCSSESRNLGVAYK